MIEKYLTELDAVLEQKAAEPSCLEDFDPDITAAEFFAKLTDLRNSLAAALEGVDAIRAEVRKEIHH